MSTENQDRIAARRTRWAWYSYDFGNTAVEFAIPLYLTVWIVSDLGVPALVFGLASAVSSWAIALTGPYFGLNADEKGRRRFWFVISVLVAGVFLASLSILPHTRTGDCHSHPYHRHGGQLLLPTVQPHLQRLDAECSRRSNVVSLSSKGMAISFAGGAVGVALMELVVSGRLIPGVSGRGYALLPAALVFVACAVPGILTAVCGRRSPSPPPSPRER